MNNKKEKGFFIYGKNVISEVLKNNANKIKKFYFVDLKKAEVKNFTSKIENFPKKVEIEIVSKDFAFKKVGEVNHQNILAQIENFEYLNFDNWKNNFLKPEKNLVLILDGISDVGNLGAIVRSAAAFGVCGIFLEEKNSAPVNGAVFKSSAGNIFSVPIIKVSNINNLIEKLKKEKFWMYALDGKSERSEIFSENSFDTNTAFVLGSEGGGVSVLTLKKSDFIINIPILKKVESLNVSVSAGIVMSKYREKFL